MVKNLQCLKTLEMCYLGHAEHHAKKRSSLRGLDHDTLFLDDPLCGAEVGLGKTKFVSLSFSNID